MKATIHFFILIVIISLNSSCKKDEPICCVNIKSDIYLHLINSEGQDLIGKGIIDSSKIKVFFMEGNKKIQKNNNPAGIFKDSNGRYLVKIFLNTMEGSEITLVEYNPLHVDTLIADYNRNGANVLLKSVNRNNKLIWSVDHANSSLFTEIKLNIK